MIEVHSVQARNYSNRSFSTNDLRLGAFMSRQDFWKVLLRLEIVTVGNGASLTVAYALKASAGAALGGSTTRYFQPGRYQIAINRSDLDNNSLIRLELTLTGTMRLGATVYFCQNGEDIPEWL